MTKKCISWPEYGRSNSVRIFLKLSFLLLVGALATTQAFAADITALRSWRAPDNTRLVIDLSGPVHYRLSPDSSPARVIVDIDDVQVAGPLAWVVSPGPVKSMRFEKHGPNQRLIIDTSIELQPKIFQLLPNEQYGHRLVLDLYDKESAPLSAAHGVNTLAEKVPAPAPASVRPDAMGKSLEKSPVVVTAVPSITSSSATIPEKPSLPVLVPVLPENLPAEKSATEKKPAVPVLEPLPEKFDAKRYRNIVVAIDAGHGGEDPGASGLKGTREKHITLAMARELEALFQSLPGITPVLTRTGDYFIPLQDRRRIARFQHKADIFVSLHADAAENRAAKGASVFALSLKGAGTATSRFARMLAERENRSDLIGGAALEKNDDILRNVLADMVVAGSLEHSLHMGHNILAGLDAIGPLHSPRVEQAGFAVLKEPGMVSLLVETGFISNPDEEKRLNDKQYQREIAKAVFDGVRRYCLQYPAPGTYFAWLSEKNRAKPLAEKPAATSVAGVMPEKTFDTKSMSTDSLQAAQKYRKHRVIGGENLTRLAAHYQVPMQTLREVNSLKDDNVMIGQVLKIPAN